MDRRTVTIASLGIAQTLAWASSYYLPAVLAVPMARDLAVSTPTVFAAFSVALLTSAALVPIAGRSIDRWEGRPVLMCANVVFALGLIALGTASGAVSLFAAWIIMGVAMGSGLYDAAFATVVRLYKQESTGAILPLTVFGSRGYGQRQGLLMAPARVVQALAPWLFGVSVAKWGTCALMLTGGLAVASFTALTFLRAPTR